MSDDVRRKAPTPRRRLVLRSLATLAFVLLAYYTVPIGLGLRDAADIFAAVLFVVGLVGLVWLIVTQVRDLVLAPEAAARRVGGIVAVMYLVVAFFALAYYLMERWSPGQFDGLATRTDALYYSVVTLGTVGYGDVNAVGQAARVVTMVQVMFDLVIVGFLATVASASIADRVAAARTRHRDTG